MKRYILLLLVILTILTMAGCYQDIPSEALPEYKREDNEQDGIVVIVDGVKYKSYPEQKWVGQETAERFATAGGKSLFLCEKDPERNFILIWDEDYMNLEEPDYILLYRTDRVIPPPSGNSIYKIHFVEGNVSAKNVEFNESKDIYDEEIINAFFRELEKNRGNKLQLDDAIGEAFSFYLLKCYSEQVKGAKYIIYLQKYRDMIVFKDAERGFVEVSDEVLEMLIGYKND